MPASTVPPRPLPAGSGPAHASKLLRVGALSPRTPPPWPPASRPRCLLGRRAPRPPWGSGALSTQPCSPERTARPAPSLAAPGPCLTVPESPPAPPSWQWNCTPGPACGNGVSAPQLVGTGVCPGLCAKACCPHPGAETWPSKPSALPPGRVCPGGFPICLPLDFQSPLPGHLAPAGDSLSWCQDFVPQGPSWAQSKQAGDWSEALACTCDTLGLGARSW